MYKWIKKQLNRIKSKPIRILVVASLSWMFCAVVFVVAIFTYAYSLGAPSLTSQQNTVYYGSSDQVIGEESGIQSRYWVDLEDISPHLVKATIAIEDQSFYDHHGFDFKRMASALFHDIKAMAMVQGASTISQQYARNLYLSHEKTWTRKIKEAFYTLRLEMFYTKDEILEGYLNTIYYGHGAYGIETASRYFFDKSAKDINLAEAATLAGIPKGPSYYSPFHDREKAKSRQELILRTMKKQDIITEEEQFLASSEKLTFTDAEDREVKSIAPYFQDAVLKKLASILDEDLESIRSGGYQVYTTLNTDHQKTLEESVQKTMESNSSLQVGAMSVEPETGAITAMLGGRSYEKSPFNRATMAERMPGSSFKPFLYYEALEHGYTATTALLSKPTTFELASGKVYAPSNYNGYYAYEPITLAQAIALSDNIYAVKTNVALDPKNLVKTARKFGIEGKLPAVPSLALGTAVVSVEEMVGGYSMIANGGQKVKPYLIEKVTDSKGNVLYEHDSDKKQVLDEKKTFILSQLMTGMFDESLNGYMRVTGASIADQLDHNLAGKSGTTNTDSWMVGFSPKLAMGVWTGYDQNKPMNKVEEHQYAKEIWASFMTKAHEGEKDVSFEQPEGVVGVYVDPKTGEKATPYCAERRMMYFEKGMEPTSFCSLHYPGDKKEHAEDKPKDEKEKENGWNKWFDWLPFGD
ncbi:PBP1A family penicillin-binding protein [Radiobacillus kanasensis]|uniref:transglycosylase domain-containing protein n=1 Tax=Radiobacillus kanasensis TaxID=2844358 RepID=UPI001E46397E|nr:PBP1A family penicillin-binding protein [Radiobacillus kanasensis]UFT98984.1 PBP1A family penicillin-binding protein [Radiobacillus kanasensis]